MTKHHLLGSRGETLACQYLETLGYEILDQNWTFQKAEIDIIAYKNQIIVFVEVKTRSGDAFGKPEEAVHFAKQKVMERAAEEYIYLMEHQGEIRFDIISILFESPDKYALSHIEDAFWPEA